MTRKIFFKIAKKHFKNLVHFKRILISAYTVVTVSLVSLIVLSTILFLIPLNKYRYNVLLMDSGDLNSAVVGFSMLGQYKDSKHLVLECYLELGLSALKNKDLDTALSCYRLICEPFSVQSEYMSFALYEYAVEMTGTRDYPIALSLFENELRGYSDSDYLAQNIRFGLGMTELSRDNYEKAYAVFITIDQSILPEVTTVIEQCKEIFYSLQIDEFDSLNRFDGILSPRIIMPEGFFSPLLDNYRDTEKYRIYSNLQGAWLTRNREENISLIYDELGDFLESKDHGFSMQRLYRRRYVSSSGRYFSIDKDGSAQTNLPRYRLGGYLGLYSKIENGVYYIGSDEARWTKQFSFSFSDYDKTLVIYCYSAGYSYTLSLDDSPIYE